MQLVGNWDRPMQTEAVQLKHRWELTIPLGLRAYTVTSLGVRVRWGGHKVQQSSNAWDDPQIICRTILKTSGFAYDLGVTSLTQFMENRLASGYAYFVREDALASLGVSSAALEMSLMRQSHNGRLTSPWRGFYLILRPEDRAFGAPEATGWIDPLMRYLELDYRVALLSAAAFFGASHQAAMVFQVIAPRQMRSFEIGRNRVQFIYQNPRAFTKVNKEIWLDSIKTDAGFAKVSGLELTLLDCVRYFHRAGGISSVAQLVKDMGGQARPSSLAKLAAFYENSSVRRLGFLLDIVGHRRQADALQPLARKAKTSVLLDPSVTPLIPELTAPEEKNRKWQLIVNETIEVDS